MESLVDERLPGMREPLIARAGRFLGDWGRQDILFAAGLSLAFGLALFLRLYHLDGEPSDIYSDIVIVFRYLQDILHGQWPFYFVDSSGPLYHYLIAPLILVLGLNYLAIKIASVVVSLAVLAALYLFVRELNLGRGAGLLAMLLAGAGSWLLIFSRLGNSQIVTPLLACLTFYFLARGLKYPAGRDLLWATLSASLGLYSYPQTFFLPPAFLAALAWFCWRGQLPWRALGRCLAWTLFLALPFAWIVARDPGNFFGGYIGSKVAGTTLARLMLWPQLVLKSLLMLHVRGDEVFRSNPAELPHLDLVTGIFFLVGLLRLLLKRDARLFWLVIWPFFFLQLPSTFVLNVPGEVPSASRTLLITPFVYLIAAVGLAWLAALAPAARLRPALVALAFVPVLWMNADRYFNVYIDGLPNHNVSFSRTIAAAIDGAPTDTRISVYGCCWGEWDSPEPYDIAYALAKPRVVYFAQPEEFTCSDPFASSSPQLIITAPEDNDLFVQITRCYPEASVTLILGPRDIPIYRAFQVPALSGSTGLRR